MYKQNLINVQRSALNEGGESLNVEPQAILFYNKIMEEEKSDPYTLGCTYDLHTFCNGSAQELTQHIEVAFNMKPNGFWKFCNSNT